ncbi:CPBP family intramembrane glutamic endopeptidase [Luteimonas terrae]|uniref:Membrane protease YdiL (CAAX protease family) n=1 Tax=Luteimonas terrae TaxID=1530191 RepID=A0ABU1XZ30_9GAMM|nr:CPBP family intramembrane glutamic endopeptidase [Luteimonas terrae]MDR7193286.1 membrane protease YdiL (CAAX protease family) [Luteimonas terrae]
MALTGRQWLLVLGSLVVAVWVLMVPWGEARTPATIGMPAVLFCVMPLGALAFVAGRGWTALFHRVRSRDVLLMLAIAALNLVVTLLMALVFTSTHHAAANPLFDSLTTAGVFERILTFALMVPQLLGEELLTVLPFLALLWWLHTYAECTRRVSVAWAWLLSAIPFALVHLPTYDWNLMQCLLVIGTARLVLTLAYVISGNLWVSTGAHVLNDWSLFGFALIGGPVAQ